MTFSGSRFSGFYFVAQAISILAWWLYLGRVPTAYGAFVPSGASQLELLAFRLPDLLVVVPASLVAGAAVLANRSWAVAPAWACAGAVNYAFVYCVAWSMARGGGWLSVLAMAPAALLSTVSALDASPSAIAIFRRAKPGSGRRHVLVTLGQITVFWSLFLAVVPAALSYLERQLSWPALTFALQRPVAAGLFLLCSALGLASGLTMARRGAGTPLPFASPNYLVVTGPYAYVRNPMVIAGLGQGVAVGLWLGSGIVLAYVLLGGLLWNLLVRPTEERDLVATFGQQFLEYRANVACWLPRPRPFVPEAV